MLYVSPEMSERLLSEAHPELAVIAVWAIVDRHGPAAQKVVKRALGVTRKLPVELQAAQRDAIFAVLSERMMAWLKETMMNPDKIPMSAAAMRFKAEMQVGGMARALLLFLDGRGLAITEEQQATIKGCEDPETMDRWLAKAATAQSVAEVLAPEKKARAKRSPPPATKRPARTAKRPATRA